VLMVAPVGFGRNEETAKDNQYMRATSLAQTEIERRALDEFSLTHLELVSRGVKVMLFRFVETSQLICNNYCY
jgi:hypothetical protein